jgi:hypothetical protein
MPSPVDSDDIYNKLLMVYEESDENVFVNQQKLTEYTNKTKEIWVEYFKN